MVDDIFAIYTPTKYAAQYTIHKTGKTLPRHERHAEADLTDEP